MASVSLAAVFSGKAQDIDGDGTFDRVSPGSMDVGSVSPSTPPARNRLGLWNSICPASIRSWRVGL